MQNTEMVHVDFFKNTFFTNVKRIYGAVMISSIFLLSSYNIDKDIIISIYTQQTHSYCAED